MKQQIWNLTSPESTSLIAEWHESMDLGSKQCPINSKHIGPNKNEVDLDLVINLKEKALTKDFIWTWYSEYLIQEHVLEIFKKEGLTGFEVKPVKTNIINNSKYNAPKIWKIIVTGWGGIAPEETGTKLIESCPGCRYTHYSGITNPELLFNEKNWDGSDFFMIWPLPSFIFITEKVSEVIKRHNLKEAKFIPIENLKDPNSFSPGRLSYYMPDKLAKRIGKPLEIY